MTKGVKCCKECTERSLGCHSICKKYKADKLRLEIKKEMYRQSKSIDIVFMKLHSKKI